MPLTKPSSVASDPFKSAKWDELASGRRLRASDAPALELLVQWHAVVQRCIDDLDAAGGQVAYQNKIDDIKPLPQIAIMKQASAEIRALGKQLGMDGPGGAGEEAGDGGIIEFQSRRASRRAGAAG